MGAITLFLLSAIPAALAVHANGPCDYRFKHDSLGGYCYGKIPIFGSRRYTWDESASNCNVIGTRLAGTKLNIDVLSNKIRPPQGSVIPMPLYRDAGSAVLRSFPTAYPFTGENDWDTGFPTPPVPKQRQCIYRRSDTLKWQNLPCTTPGFTLCEYTPSTETTPDPGPEWGSTVNAYYLFPAFTATKAKAVATCSAVGATVYDFEDGAELAFGFLLDTGLIPYPATYLPLWTDAAISDGVWRFARGSLAVGAPSPKARPKTKCLGRAYKSPSGPLSLFKATCDKKYRFFCRLSAIDAHLTGTATGRSAGTVPPIPIPFETVPFNITIADLFTKKQT